MTRDQLADLLGTIAVAWDDGDLQTAELADLDRAAEVAAALDAIRGGIPWWPRLAALRDADRAAALAEQDLTTRENLRIEVAKARAEAFREAAEMAEVWRFGGKAGLAFELRRKAAEAEGGGA